MCIFKRYLIRYNGYLKIFCVFAWRNILNNNRKIAITLLFLSYQALSKVLIFYSYLFFNLSLYSISLFFKDIKFFNQCIFNTIYIINLQFICYYSVFPQKLPINSFIIMRSYLSLWKKPKLTLQFIKILDIC